LGSSRRLSEPPPPLGSARYKEPNRHLQPTVVYTHDTSVVSFKYYSPSASPRHVPRMQRPPGPACTRSLEAACPTGSCLPRRCPPPPPTPTCSLPLNAELSPEHAAPPPGMPPGVPSRHQPLSSQETCSLPLRPSSFWPPRRPACHPATRHAAPPPGMPPRHLQPRPALYTPAPPPTRPPLKSPELVPQLHPHPSRHLPSGTAAFTAVQTCRSTMRGRAPP
jgi:hypothetical protein